MAIFVIILCGLICAISIISGLDDIASKYQTSELVPDAFPSPPENPIEVTYTSGAEVNFGNELTPTAVKDVPDVNWNANSEDFHTLIFVDLDAPSRKDPTFREVIHWMVVNIPGANVDEGETIIEFIGSGPSKGTDLHRYAFFVFKQPSGKLDFSAEDKVDKRNIKKRISFSTIKFAEKYSLELLGGNFYQAQYDDYVPILHAQFHSE
ncbi:protein D3-like [Phlebotomus papatasi]|uniref:protein D3-like n=1 Tax=Phlebotomus papatasi TaxID=29031 RepID=UPI002483D32D|nr:protein D3-like [Phlebotomus papatasi]